VETQWPCRHLHTGGALQAVLPAVLLPDCVVTPVIEQILLGSPGSHLPTCNLNVYPSLCPWQTRPVYLHRPPAHLMTHQNVTGMEHLHTVRFQGADLGCLSPDVKNSIHVGDWFWEINSTSIRNMLLAEIQETSCLLQLTLQHDPCDSSDPSPLSSPVHTPSRQAGSSAQQKPV
jgi:LIM domain kinase 1